MGATNTVLFLQGGGAGVHDEWDARLAASLRRELGDGFEVRYPRLPSEADPSPATWGPAILAELAALPDGAFVAAHSVGGTVLVQALASAGGAAVPALGGIVLVAAPFAGEGGWPSEGLTFPDRLGDRLPAGVPVHVVQGLADETVPPAHADLWARAVPRARVHRLPGRDHQLDDSMAEVAALVRGG